MYSRATSIFPLKLVFIFQKRKVTLTSVKFVFNICQKRKVTTTLVKFVFVLFFKRGKSQLLLFQAISKLYLANFYLKEEFQQP